MGQALAESVTAAPDLELAGVWRRGDDLDGIVAGAAVLIDFSLPEATATVVATALSHRTPLVCGVSGLSDAQQQSLDAAAEQLPLLYDRNMSLGIAVMDALVRQAAVALGAGFSVEIHETHHANKIDAPSGTALKLGESIAAAARLDADAIRYQSERRGDVPGDHSVIFRSATETLTLAHSVTTRQVFVDGALRAARWLVGQKPGRYRMSDALT